jgi:thiol:disulfide interchange protein
MRIFSLMATQPSPSSFAPWRRVVLTGILAGVLASLTACGTQAPTPKNAPADGSAPASDAQFYIGIRKVTADEIYQALPDTQGKPLYIEFKSKYCLACKKMEPILTELLPQYPEVEQRVFDMMADKETHRQVFETFQPMVVPVQIFVNAEGTITNVLYDFHEEATLRQALDAIRPNTASSEE